MCALSIQVQVPGAYSHFIHRYGHRYVTYLFILCITGYRPRWSLLVAYSTQRFAVVAERAKALACELALRLQVRIPRGLFCFVVKFDFGIDCRHFVFLLDLTFKLSKVSINCAAYSVNQRLEMLFSIHFTNSKT